MSCCQYEGLSFSVKLKHTIVRIENADSLSRHNDMLSTKKKKNNLQKCLAAGVLYMDYLSFYTFVQTKSCCTLQNALKKRLYYDNMFIFKSPATKREGVIGMPFVCQFFPSVTLSYPLRISWPLRTNFIKLHSNVPLSETVCKAHDPAT